MRYTKCSIIRTGDKHDTRAYLPVQKRPERVALLIDEKRFVEGLGIAQHRETIFILDRMHDWEYSEKHNAIRVFGTIDPDSPLDIVVAYEIEEDPKQWARIENDGSKDCLVLCVNGWQSQSTPITPHLARLIRKAIDEYLGDGAIKNAGTKRKPV